MRAIILSIGDELTLGQALDTNSQWLAAQLAERSTLTIEHRTVADDRRAIADAIDQCTTADRCDVLIVTGGLGPTDDDLTREAVGDVVAPGQPLERDEAAARWLERWFAGRGRGMPAINARQALRPRGFRCLKNPHGTAPGIAGEHAGCRIYCLPGPPREMQPMFHDHVAPDLPASSGDDALLTARVQEFGMGESVAAERLGGLMGRDRNPLIGTTASNSIVSARIRVCGPIEQARTLLCDAVAQVQRFWHPYAFASGDASLADALGAMLLQRGLRLATAESCTGGMLASSIVDRSGSSAYFLGGWITYANDLKTRELGVTPELIQRHGAVSEPVARSMAEGAMRRSGSNCALAVTGVAGPEGGTPGKPVGTVFIAAALTGQPTRVRQFHFPGERDVVRDRSAKAALQMLRFALLSVPDAPMIWEVRGESAAESVPGAQPVETAR